jgi:hypothetical protein
MRLKRKIFQRKCFCKKKTKEKQETTTSSDLDSQIGIEKSQIKERNKHPAKKDLEFVKGIFLLL